jgi:hypothetical protein
VDRELRRACIACRTRRRREQPRSKSLASSADGFVRTRATSGYTIGAAAVSASAASRSSRRRVCRWPRDSATATSHGRGTSPIAWSARRACAPDGNLSRTGTPSASHFGSKGWRRRDHHQRWTFQRGRAAQSSNTVRSVTCPSGPLERRPRNSAWSSGERVVKPANAASRDRDKPRRAASDACVRTSARRRTRRRGARPRGAWRSVPVCR